MGRPILALLTAPLWVPVIFVAAMIVEQPPAESPVVEMTIVFALFAYAGAALFGIPAYLLLRRSSRALLGAAIGLGFVAGAVTWGALLIVLEWGPAMTSLSPWEQQMFLPAGAVGSLVGVTLWLIARPRASHRLAPQGRRR
jgi:hypothetical protein